MRKGMLGTLLLCFGIATVAAADPVKLTSGGITVYSDGPSNVIFDGSGTGFAAGGSGGGGLFLRSLKVGDTLDLSQSISFAPGRTDAGFITTGGVTRSGFLGGILQISATPFVLGTSGPFTTPFTMHGFLQLFAQPFDPDPSSLLFTQEVTATGVASFDARNVGDGYLRIDPAFGALGLQFAPATSPSPTPEPASLLLMATGIVPLMLRRRR